jgi:lipopolysaccharide transport system ATP-binding protein
MNDIVIRVENLGKLYRLGQYVGYGTLREGLTNAFAAPLRRIRRMGGAKREVEPSPPTTDRNDHIWALKDISFEVKQSEVVGIIGRNGAGKSTLLKILTRITGATEGYAEIHGRVGSLLEVGTGFHPELTGRENIFLNGAILGMKKAEVKRKFDEIVEFSGVEKFIDTPLKRFSSGMQVRLAFAVAAHLEPEILLVDEVLAVGDVGFQKKCLGKMENISQQGRTVLFVSHNMQAVRSLCPRCILLKDGRVSIDAPTTDTILAYYNDLRLLTVDEDTDVANPKNRRGSGEARFTEIRIQDESGEECSNFTMGSTIRFTLSYKTFAEVDNLLLSIALRSGKSGELITSAGHLVSGESLPAEYTGSVVIELPHVNLRPGDYPLYFWLGSSTKRAFDVVDDLTMPLIILPDEDFIDSRLGTAGKAGYFKIESRML